MASFLDARSELLHLIVSHFVEQETFQRSGMGPDAPFSRLLRRLAVEDPEWTAELIGWLREECTMRAVSHVAAVDYVRARAGLPPSGGPRGRAVIASVLRRADEPGELLALWTARHGRNVPKPVKRGIADAAARLWDGEALLRHDTPAASYRFGDVLNLVHAAPDPAKPWQGELFRYALDRRHHPETAVAPAADRAIAARHALTELPVAARRALALEPGGARRIAEAQIAWEELEDWLKAPVDAEVWEAVIPEMEPADLLHGLPDFDRAGVSDEAAAEVAARIADPEAVARSCQFPFGYLAAYQRTPSLRWSRALEEALGHSLTQVPALPGRTLILVDRSASMWSPLGVCSPINKADAAAVFGIALAMRAESADLVQFGSTTARVRFRPGESVLEVLRRFDSLGGTHVAVAVGERYRGHDRVLIVTDEQTEDGAHPDPGDRVPPDVPVYSWNLAGRPPVREAPATPARHFFGGLTDDAFRMVPLLEDPGWPWERER